MKKLNFNNLKVGDRIKVIRKDDRYGWYDSMEESLGKIMEVVSFKLPSGEYPGSICLPNGLHYPPNCFDFKKSEVPKWKKIWKND